MRRKVHGSPPRIARLACAQTLASHPSFAGLVVLAGSLNPIPSRTRPLNSPAPMVLSLKTWESRSLPGLPRTDFLFTMTHTENARRQPRRAFFCFGPAVLCLKGKGCGEGAGAPLAGRARVDRPRHIWARSDFCPRRFSRNSHARLCRSNRDDPATCSGSYQTTAVARLGRDAAPPVVGRTASKPSFHSLDEEQLVRPVVEPVDVGTSACSILHLFAVWRSRAASKSLFSDGPVYPQ